jgi:hypothetical protein
VKLQDSEAKPVLIESISAATECIGHTLNDC